MGIISRTRIIFGVKTNAALDSMQDPVQTFDFAEQQQRDLLRKVGQGLIEVATARQRLTKKAEALRGKVPMLEDQARRALDADREDLARIALQRKQIALNELGDLEAHIEEVTEEEKSLTIAHQQLTMRVEEFQHRRTTTTARYESASARVKVSESLTGVSGDLAELSMAVGRAEEKTERLQSRASAIDGLIASGAFSTPIGEVDRVERELREIAATKAVDEEIAAMKSRTANALDNRPV